LVEIAYEWVMKGRWGVAFKEFNTNACNGEYPDVIGFCSGPSVVVEVKANRSDFMADKVKMFRRYPEQGMGKWRYYLCPEGLIKKEELPEGWGLIYVSPDTGKTRTVHKPLINEDRGHYAAFLHYEFEHNIRAENGLMYSALRRLQLRGRIDEVYDNPFDKTNKP
jgi:hypothetical protein